MGKQRIDATEGSLPRGIIAYAVPLMFSTLLQYGFNAADIAVLGNMADSVAVAAVGATGAITNVIINGFVGFSSGCKIILARQIGEGNREHVKKTVDTSILSAAAIGILIAIVGIVLAPQFLDWTNCPADCFNASKLYTRIYLAASPAIMLYNFGSSILISVGDTKRPLYYIAIAGGTNLVLNVILCLILPQKVLAVAIATAASQIIGAFLVCRRLVKMDGIGRLVLGDMKWHAKTFRHIVGYGAPLSFSHLLGPVSDLQVQSAVNAIGVSAVAGNSAGLTVNNLIHAFCNPIGTATVTFMGQNIGAGKKERVSKTIWHCFWIGFAVTTTVSLFFYFSRNLWFGLILTDNVTAIGFAEKRLVYITTFYLPFLINSVMSHVIQVYGYSLFYGGVNVVCILGFRSVWMQTVYPRFFENTEHAFLGCMLCIILAVWLQVLVVSVAGAIFHRRYIKRDVYKKNL